ncbi:MAG: hypothetical protein MI702_07040, partial [Chlorobiales bacterium]|nr:hypothetical protein [Chlorobiales bacterium]
MLTNIDKIIGCRREPSRRRGSQAISSTNAQIALAADALEGATVADLLNGAARTRGQHDMVQPMDPRRLVDGFGCARRAG